MDQRGAPEFILEAFADPNSVRDIVRGASQPRKQKAVGFCCPLPLNTKPIPLPFAITYPKLTESCFFFCPGILHTIFFLRYFPSIVPQTRDVLGLELAHIPEAEIETLIDQRVAALVRQLESERHQPHNPSSDRGGLGHGLGLGLTGTGGTPPSSGGGGGRGQITIQFLEKRRRKTWYAMRGDDEICWESWTVKVTVADPRTEGGMSLNPPRNPCLTPFPRTPPKTTNNPSALSTTPLTQPCPIERAKVRRASETTLHNTIMKAVTLANAHKDHIPPITTTESNPFPYQINIGSNSNSSNSGGGGGGGGGQQKDAVTAAAATGGWATRMGIY